MFENAVVAAIHRVRLSQIETARANALGCTRGFNHLQIEIGVSANFRGNNTNKHTSRP